MREFFNVEEIKKYADQLYKIDAMYCHGAAINCQGKAYVFFAPSKTGKSTHLKFWMKLFADEISMINDDKPIIKLEDGKVIVESSPYCGKEGWKVDGARAELGAICILKRGEENSIKKVLAKDHFEEILNQIYRPEDNAAMLKTFDLIDKVFKNCDIYEMYCLPNEEAAIMAHDTMVKK